MTSAYPPNIVAIVVVEKYFEPEERLFNLVKKQIVTAGDNVKFFLRKKKAKQNETVEKSVTFDAFPRDSTHCDTLKSKSSTTGEFQKYRHISDLVQSILDENFNDISFDSSSLKQEHLHSQYLVDLGFSNGL